MDHAEQNLIFAVAGGVDAIVVARLDEHAWEGPGADGVQAGALRLSILRDLTQGLWRGPQELALGCARFADPARRFREGSLGFNGIRFERGAHLLLAIATTGAGELS